MHFLKPNNIYFSHKHQQFSYIPHTLVSISGGKINKLPGPTFIFTTLFKVQKLGYGKRHKTSKNFFEKSIKIQIG